MERLYGEDFIRMIQSFNPTARPVSGRREIVVRCRECGDSVDPKHAHLYISVPQSPDELSVYQCKKCMHSGIVDEYFLRKYGCDNLEYINEITKQVRSVMSSPKYAALRLTRGRKLMNSYISDRPYNEQKLRYINERIDSNFTFQDLNRLKIFLNITDVLSSNNLAPTMSEQDVMELDDHFIGFIGYDNTRAICRRFDNSISSNWMGKLRYVNYNFVNSDDAKTFYVIPSTVDLENYERTHIHIAEGVFDVLGIFYNLCGCSTTQNIYISASGKSYRQALEFILTGVGIINYDVHFYPDKDVTDKEFSQILRVLEYLPTDFYIHRNLAPGQKDFGVPKNYIREGVTTRYEKML